MRIGLCYGDFDNAAQKLPLVREMGYDYIEVALCRLSEFTDEQVRAFGEAAKNAGLTTEATNIFFSGKDPIVGPAVNAPAIYEYTRKALAKAAALGVKTSVLGSGAARTIPEGFGRDAAFAQMAELTYGLGEIAKEFDIRIVIEPLNRKETNFVNSGSEGLELMEKVHHDNVGILLDYYHMAVENEDMAIVGTAAKSGKLLHAHLSAASRVFPRGDELTDCERFLAALKAAGYDGRLSIECAGDAFAENWDAKSIREALARA